MVQNKFTLMKRHKILNMDLPKSKKYGVIYADPPWLFKTRSDKGKDRSPEKHYPVLHIADICNLPVSDIET